VETNIGKNSVVNKFQLAFGKYYGVTADPSDISLPAFEKSKTLETVVEFQMIKSGFHTLVTKQHGSASVFDENYQNCSNIKFHEITLVALENKKHLHELISKLKENLDLITIDFQNLTDLLIQELLLNLDFHQLQKSVQFTLFQALQAKKYSCQVLCFKNSEFLNLKTLLRILKCFQSLCTLILVDCPLLNQPFLVDKICQTVPNLLEIRLEKIKLKHLTCRDDP
jgi:hypothetical protein